MSVLSDHVREVAEGGLTRGALPRVNLLPPEIAERARFRRIQYGLGLGVVGALGVVTLLYVGASSGVNDAQTDLTAATDTGSTLTAEAGRYSEVTAVYAKAAAAQGMLTAAMGQEVRYSQLLNDLSLSVPENVWFTDIGFTQTDGATPAAAPAAGAVATDPGIGQVTFSGTAFTHDDVAVWLESLATQKGLADPYFSSSTEKLIGTRKAVEFTSTATLTPAALSGRFTAPQGG